MQLQKVGVETPAHDQAPPPGASTIQASIDKTPHNNLLTSLVPNGNTFGARAPGGHTFTMERR